MGKEPRRRPHGAFRPGNLRLPENICFRTGLQELLIQLTTPCAPGHGYARDVSVRTENLSA